MFASIGFLIAATAVSSIASASDVWIVAPSGGQFTDVQPAVDAASAGDTILVKQGVYSGFTVDGKALSIVGEIGSLPQIHGEILIEHLPAHQTFVLARLRAVSTNALAFVAQHNDGALRIESCTLLGKDSNVQFALGAQAVSLADNSDVVMTNCNVHGGQGWIGQGSSSGGLGLFARNSTTELYACTIGGGDGGYDTTNFAYDGGKGGNALEIPEGVVFASASQFNGGNGGGGSDEYNYCSGFGILAGDGGDGGDGVFVGSLFASSATPSVTLVACAEQGGIGGSGGQGNCGPDGQHGAHGLPIDVKNGSATTLSDPARFVSAAPLARESSAVALNAFGAPGDKVFATITSPSTAPASSSLGFGGPPLARHVLLGTIPASGVLSAVIRTPELGPNVDSRLWLVLPEFVDASSASHVGNSFALVLVDQQF